jgi:beta-N-acetylhexosaminidase
MPNLSSLRAPGFRGSVRTSGVSKAQTSFFLSLVLLFSLANGHSEPTDNIWTDNMLKSLSLRQKIAQMIQIRVPGKFINRRTPEFQAIKDQIQQNRVGGVVLFAGNVYESAILLNELQTLSKLPLLVAADFERGLSFRIADTTSFPWTMAIGAAGSEQYAYQQGLVTGQESRALGVHWIFAPVVDVNNNPDNPVINIRSFGEDPALVARLGSAFIRGARQANVLTTAKHFPGHGDTSTNSHLGLAVIDSDLARLQALEFVPFKSAIAAGVDSIMTAHVAVPNLTDSPELPATLSWKILTDILRNQLKFDGLVVTDALEMGGITNSYWCGLAAVRAVQAGADVLLLPTNTTVAINEVERAVKRGAISESRIDQSVRKILGAKNRLGLPRTRTVPISRIGDIIASPRSAQLAQDIADHSIVVVKDDPRLLPINPLNDTRVFSLVLASDLETSPGAVFQAEMRRHFANVRTAWANARISEDLISSIDKSAAESDLIICSTLARLSTANDTIAIPQNQQAILKKLAGLKKPFIWISFGNPYVLRLVPEVGAYLCAFSYSDVSQIAAAKALAGEIAVTGKMPVSIPGHIKVGDGLQIPKLPMTLNWETPQISGLPAERFEAGKKMLEAYIQAGVFPGAELLVGYQGSVVLDFCAGKTGVSKESTKVSPETNFELASLSRMLRTVSAAMLATDSGILLPATPVRDYLPEYEGKDNGKLRVQDLLGGLSRSSGTEALSMDWRASLLDRIAARASGVSLDRFLEKSLFEPLGMRVVRPATPASTLTRARDLAILAQMLLNKGMYRHRRYFRPETIAKYTGPQGAWSKPTDLEWLSPLFSASAFGHTSAEGPALWIDPAKKLFIILLANKSDSANPAAVDDAQRKIFESLTSEITSYE